MNDYEPFSQRRSGLYLGLHTNNVEAPISINGTDELWERPNHFAIKWAGYLTQLDYAQDLCKTLEQVLIYLDDVIDVNKLLFDICKQYIINQKNNWEQLQSEQFIYVTSLLSFRTAAESFLHKLDYAVRQIIQDYKQAIGWSANGSVYFLLAEEVKLVKIGFQSTKNNPRSRSIHSHCPYDLVHLGSITVGHGIKSENIMHQDFKYWHYNREWFRYDDEVERRINFYLNRGYYDDCVKAMKYKEYNLSEYICSINDINTPLITEKQFMVNYLKKLFATNNNKPVKRQYLLTA